MTYCIELYDHKEHQKVLVYGEGQNEVEAALSVMDRVPMAGQIKNIKQMREFYLTSSLQFIGIKEDRLVKINNGGKHEIPKSIERNDSPKQKKTRRSSSKRHSK